MTSIEDGIKHLNKQNYVIKITTNMKTEEF